MAAARSRPTEGIRPVAHARAVRRAPVADPASTAPAVPVARSTWVAVGVASVVLYVVAAVWACLTPGFRAPDEPQHISTVFTLAYDHSYPAPGDARWYPAIQAAYHDLDQNGTAQHMGDATGDAGRHLTLRQLAATFHDKLEINQMTQHPPLYYASLAIPVRLFDLDGATARGAVVGVRLLSALWLLPLPLLIFLLGRAMGLRERAAASSFLPLAIPQFDYLGGAVTNDIALVTLTAWLVLVAVRVARGDARVGSGLLLGGVYSLTLLTKGLALAYVPMLLLAYWLCARRSGGRRAARSFGAAVAASLPGFAWWVGNVVAYHAIQPNGYPKGFIDALPNGHLSFGSWLGQFLDLMARTFWLDYGWIELSPQHWAYLLATAAVLGAVVVAFARYRDRRGVLGVLLLSWVPVLLLVLFGGFQSWQQTASVRGAQGRYLFAGVAALAVSAAMALAPRTSRGGAQRWWAAVPVLALGIALGGLERGLWHFYAGATLARRLDAFSSWTPVHLRVLGALLALCVALAVVAAVILWRPVGAPAVAEAAGADASGAGASGASGADQASARP
jgi:4-amino-4-deoxy-L-arabinose transferase-like glycosyltransferase